MAQPFDYSLNLPSPVAAIQEGLLLGRQLQAARIEQEALRKEAEREQKLEAILPGYLNNPNRTFNDFYEVYNLLPQEQRGMFEEQFQQQSKDQRRNFVSRGLQVLSALNSDTPSVGLAMLDEQEAAARNAGDEETAKMLGVIREQAKINPTMTEGLYMPVLMAADSELVRNVLQQRGDAAAPKRVQSSKILPGGVVVSVMNDGSRSVRDAEGNELTGQQAARAVAEAERSGIDLRGEAEAAAAGARARVRGATEPGITADVTRAEVEARSRNTAIDEASKSIPKMESMVSTYRRALELVKSGAGTGAIERFMPSFRAASVELDQLQKQGALDVIGAVTLGAISEGELDLVKQVAIPVGLNERELAGWLQRRIDAQGKLIKYLDDQIEYLNQGGTVAGWRTEYRRRNAAGGTQLPTADQIRAERDRRRQAGGR